MDTRNRRLMSPAETLNGLTVGAVHADGSNPTANSRLIDPFEKSIQSYWSPPASASYASERLPSTVSAHGPGFRRSIKPEIYLPGGRQFLSEHMGGTRATATLGTPSYTDAPGQRVATPGPPGQLDKTLYTRGTSNATALASRGANFLYDIIEEMRAPRGSDLPGEYDAILTKALLVHGADWSQNRSRYESILGNSQNGNISRERIGQFLGYGSANITRVTYCTDQRVTVLGFGELDDNEGHEFDLPFPPSLSAVNEWRRLTITLAWFTPIKSSHRSYRVAHLWFELVTGNEIAPNRVCADARAAQRGTVQHEILEGNKAVFLVDGDAVRIKVNCRADAGDITEPIRYGLAVSLEIAESANIPIYQEVRERLGVRIPVEAEGSI